jgi:hypothetical protein
MSNPRNRKINGADRIKSYLIFTNDWNGYGAKPFSKKLIEKCLKFYSKIEKYNPEVFPTGRSTVQFEFRDGERYLEFEVYIDKIAMLEMDGDWVVCESDQFLENFIYRKIQEFFSNVAEACEG